jgi:hypothetical protein
MKMTMQRASQATMDVRPFAPPDSESPPGREAFYEFNTFLMFKPGLIFSKLYNQSVIVTAGFFNCK